jgi:hypothetical protein
MLQLIRKPLKLPKGVTIRELDAAKLANADSAETRLGMRLAKYLLNGFPPEYQVPLDSVSLPTILSYHGVYGDSPFNREFDVYTLKADRLVGGACATYLANSSSVLVGYLKVSNKFQRHGIGRALFEKMVDLGELAAAAAGKPLISVCGEVESPGNSHDPAYALSRLAMFIASGGAVLDSSTGFTYGQPNEDGSFAPLNLVFSPLQPVGGLSHSEVSDIINGIFSTIYAHLPKDVFDSSLERILRSIPTGGLALRTDFECLCR